jgi:hypothetical protein
VRIIIEDVITPHDPVGAPRVKENFTQSVGADSAARFSVEASNKVR